MTSLKNNVNVCGPIVVSLVSPYVQLLASCQCCRVLVFRNLCLFWKGPAQLGIKLKRVDIVEY